ncbi:G1/S-specific cyclin pas1 [Smittium culicis]|uniref:G1/S-specific cyclin pas1 n=1 Tax=Smittium culicis TaxID=133412 RepID=A0A1R1WYQ8_9FUNG|nr:G1/S-specific cyclin pas1 [Smittium culicis]OMJ23104.1 G1/S-specific cyclin pas1 [Smittium culicis]
MLNNHVTKNQNSLKRTLYPNDSSCNNLTALSPNKRHKISQKLQNLQQCKSETTPAFSQKLLNFSNLPLAIASLSEILPNTSIPPNNNNVNSLQFALLKKIALEKSRALASAKLSKLVNVIAHVLNTILPCNNFNPDIAAISSFVSSSFQASKLPLSILEVALIYILRAKSALLASNSSSPQLPTQQYPNTLDRPTSIRLSSSQKSSLERFFSDSEKFKQSIPINSYPNTPNFEAVSSATTSPTLSPVTPIALDTTNITLVSQNPNNTSIPFPLPTSPLKQSLSNDFPSNVSPNHIQTVLNTCNKSTEFCNRIFLASLISASKFCLDKSLSNKAWFKITTLPTSNINSLETSFLNLINFKLFVSQQQFSQCRTLIDTLL